MVLRSPLIDRSQGWKFPPGRRRGLHPLHERSSEYPVITFFDGLWSYRGYPDLMFANFFARPAENLKQWDEAFLPAMVS